MAKYIKPIEDDIVDWAKQQLITVKYYNKNDTINTEIENALKIAPSKLGKNGPNRPDIKLFLEISFGVFKISSFN